MGVRWLSSPKSHQLKVQQYTYFMTLIFCIPFNDIVYIEKKDYYYFMLSYLHNLTHVIQNPVGVIIIIPNTNTKVQVTVFLENGLGNCQITLI